MSYSSFNFYWNIVALQYHVSSGVQHSDAVIPLQILFYTGYHKMLSVVAFALQ